MTEASDFICQNIEGNFYILSYACIANLPKRLDLTTSEWFYFIF